MHHAIRILRDEHRSIGRMLAALQRLARAGASGRVRPSLRAVRAQLYAIDVFAEQRHHPKEGTALFGRLLVRDPGAQALVGELFDEHLEGAQHLRSLERAVIALEHTWPEGASDFAAMAERFARFQMKHMRKEERLLPRARHALSDADWRSVETAFASSERRVSRVKQPS